VHIHDYYYDAKPYIPWKLRMAARRVYLSGRRRNCQSIWPIDPASARKPENWPGWPDGKKFAFVLTHDVEGRSGLAKCKKLMELEISIGFRSCFNFIPEGEYRVSPELRTLLGANGFEVGVHDLYHDGKLYRSREGFRANAALINNYLKAWGAFGFRSGFMHHNLEWLHDLNIAYDCSTFDTDPFEPQPEAAGTIFPFWVEPPSGYGVPASAGVPSPSGYGVPPSGGIPAGDLSASPDLSTLNGLSSVAPAKEDQPSTGYLELPYTLPQDSTLFLLFNQRSVDIWKRKLDWIASQGGMALLNVHPDYMHFESDEHRGPHFPASFYREFLAWVREKYAGQYWHAVPRDLAAYCTPFRPRRPRTARRIAMLTHSFYKTDARVTRYAEALVARGDHVDVLALSSSSDHPPVENVRGVNLVRLQRREGKKEKSRLGFLLPVLRFLISGSFWIARNHSKRPYDLLHIHNIPDFLVFAAWFPKRRGAKVILDIHDIVPEFYASKFNRPASSWGIKMLKLAERLSARVADHVIIANDLWLEKYAARTGKNGDCSVFINNVDTDIFGARPRTRTDSKTIILFPGGLQWHQGLDIAIRALAKVLSTLNGRDAFHRVPNNPLRSEISNLESRHEPELSTLNSQLSTNLEFHIYGDGNMKPQLIALAAQLGLQGKVRFFNPLPVREIADIMANADLGVVPKRADSFGNEAYSTKIMEFMALGVPVVVSSTRIDRFYFNESVVRFFPSGDHEAMAAQILDLLTNAAARKQQIANALEYATANSWENRKHDYLALVDSMIDGRPAPPHPIGRDAFHHVPNPLKSQIPNLKSSSEPEFSTR
jgi:glycosyltransferase involved in cell wall biosynthesis